MGVTCNQNIELLPYSFSRSVDLSVGVVVPLFVASFGELFWDLVRDFRSLCHDPTNCNSYDNRRLGVLSSSLL